MARSPDEYSPARLTDAIIRKLEPPAEGNKLKRDTERTGLAIRVTANGVKSFVFSYRTRAGVERRATIGPFPAWSVAAARDEADDLRRRVNLGGDPLSDLAADRGAPTVDDLCERFREEHLPKKRPATRTEYARYIDSEIRPALGKLKVAAVTFADVDKLHRQITKRAPIQANRILAVVSKIFSHAIRLKMRHDNPAKGVERNVEHKRHRYLTSEEIARLTDALSKHPDQEAANILRLCLLTGARVGEVRSARWSQFDLEAGKWTKPGSTTKQKSLHHAVLSAPAQQLLSELREAADDESDYVFPSKKSKAGYRSNDVQKKHWAAIIKAAKIKDVHVHDLRHSFATLVANSGGSLLLIGRLLGHSNPATTDRYAHLFDDPLRQAVERVGAEVVNAGKQPKAKIVALR